MDNREKEMLFPMMGVPTKGANMSQLPKWIRIFGYFAFSFFALSGLTMLVLSILFR
ncbi:hypothetical protein [Lysinibacillus xylanilyticus]|uniref:hypothetical protein n=1 Tax=Lysinibacillus xylanilyticus TaxID=582475 RepID=UPI003D00CC46